jgi:pimeloyl-ACP methyl ester carboxylesterase
MTLIAWLVAGYAGICVAAYFGNRLLMYIPDPTRITPAMAGLEGVREVEINVSEGILLVVWYSPAKGNQPTILYFHGNGANAANRAPKIETIRAGGFGVLYLNNRGYGGSGGKPTEENNVADAIAAYDYLIGLGVPASSIVAYGESLGSGQAVRLAAKRPVAAVVLEAPPYLDGRCWTDDLFLAATRVTDHRQVR